MNETPKKLRPVERRSYSDVTHVLTGSVGFRLTVIMLRDCSVQLHSPEQGTVVLSMTSLPL